MLFTLLACATLAEIDPPECRVSLSTLEPAQAAPGSSVTVTGAPFTEDWDTAVYVGGKDATLATLERDCDACDECRDDNGCDACEDCDACDLQCKQTCVETATFVVPELAPGPYDVRLFNAHGQSTTLTLEVIETKPKDTADTGDTGDTGK